MKSLCLQTLLCFVAFANSALAQLPTQFTLPVQPVYDLTLFDGTPFNGSGMDLTLPLTALGEMEFTFANNDINNPLATSADFSQLTGEFAGQLPGGVPFDLRPFSFLSGGLTNIVRDINGDFVSADASFTVLFEQVVLPNTPNEARILGDAGMTFTATVDAIPFAIGTSFVSPDRVDVLADLGTSMPLVGFVDNRFLNVVPEPSSLLLGALGTGGLLMWRRLSR